MKKVLSIVIPVYKVEKYINKCLDSLILPPEQMEKMEIIVINDGTPDNSAIMAKEYEKKYPDTIKVIDKENGGHGSAWNKGVELATGKYLRFLDSDDWLDNKNLSILINNLECCNADMVFTHRNRYYENTGENIVDKIFTLDYGKTLSLKDNYLLDFGNTKEMTNFWYCTYKTELLKSVTPLFIHKIMFDDSILFIAPILLSSTYVCYNMVLYNYLLGRSGQTVGAELKHLDFRLKVQESMIIFENNHPAGNDSIARFVSTVMLGRINSFNTLITLLPLRKRHRMLKEWAQFVHTNAIKYEDKTFLHEYWKHPILYNLYLDFKGFKRMIYLTIKKFL